MNLLIYVQVKPAVNLWFDRVGSWWWDATWVQKIGRLPNATEQLTSPWRKMAFMPQRTLNCCFLVV